MATVLSHTDPRISWAGAISLETTDEWTQPWRIPHEQKGLFHEGLHMIASMPAGVRITFLSDTTEVVGRIEKQVMELDAWGRKPVDLYCDGEYVGSEDLPERTEFVFRGLKPGMKLIELWLPQLWKIKLRSLELSDGAKVERYDDPRPKWLTYGSSISHCAEALQPSETWPGLVAREMGYNLTSLGYGGNCYLEPNVAMMVRDRPVDYLSMCVGINIQIAATHSARTFAQSIIGFTHIVREGHPDTPFVIMSPVISPPRETVPNPVGLSIEMMREEVQAAVEALRAHGDDNVHYVDGLDVFGADDVALMPDDLHPNAEGYKVMAKKFMEKAARPYFT